MPFSDLNGDPEICLSVNRAELTIKYRRAVMKKLILKQKSGPYKKVKISIKHPKIMIKFRQN